MKGIKGIILWSLVGVFVILPTVIAAKESLVADDEFTIEPGITTSVDISANDHLENLPQFGWRFVISQHVGQGLKFSYWAGRLTVFEPDPGIYFLNYSYTLSDEVHSATIKIIVLNWDGSDPPQPTSPISPLFLPLAKNDEWVSPLGEPSVKSSLFLPKVKGD